MIVKNNTFNWLNNRVILIFIIVFIFVSCSKNRYKKTSDNNGEITIVSLAPSITRELVDLGLKDNIVGATSFCDITSDHKDLVVGSAISVNVEKILLLKPDIVFASGLTKENTILALKNNGVKVYTFGKVRSFEVICDHFLELAEYVDKKEEAKRIIKKSKNKIDSLIATIPVKKDSLNVFFQVGAKPIFTVIPNTFMNDFITLAGCKNIADDMTRGTINRETVLNRNPDVIFIISMGILGDKEIKIWKTYPELKAAKNNKVFIVDANIAATPTVLSFVETFEIIINDIYSDEDFSIQ